ncbi:MAG: DNA mismatch repair endonuclease MutL [Gemmatimonadota bacterium]
MARRIHILPDAVANQIAAGEVVERPASAVKELVENALDAGAHRIEVGVERGGRRRIRVVDDGWGMSREDALLALDRHATSKISHADELKAIRTFGFRGEALPSIGAVSRLVLETRDEDDEVGTRVTVHGGGIVSVEDLPRQRGTTVEVRNLFYNAPARAKFLKSVSAETRAVSEAVTALALANPHVSFRLTSDGRVLLDLPPAKDVAARLAAVWPGEEVGTLLALAGEGEGFTLRGLVQRPDAARRGFRRAHLFVNGRPIRAPRIMRAAERGYRTTIPQGARPWIFLYLEVPAGAVDVNVHPAKAEVRFRDEAAVERFVEEAVRAALQGEESAATFEVRTEPVPLLVREERPSGAGASVGEAGEAGEAAARRKPASREGNGGGTPEGAEQMAFFASVPALQEAGVGRAADGERIGEEAGGDAAGAGAAGEEGGEMEGLSAGGRPRLWQALRTYILAETRDGLLIVDQHSAHERVLFQRLMDAFEAGGQESQRLLFPLTLRLSRAEYDVVEELSGLFRRAGFEVEGFGGDTVIVHAVPAPHPYFDAERAFREMVHDLATGSELSRAARNQHERIAAVFACKSAIKAGQVLSQEEMQQLFDELFATELPHHDVHGRPTIIRLPARELERRFERSGTGI